MAEHPKGEKCVYEHGCEHEQCYRWMEWFKQEWRKIRRAAELMKKQEGDKKHE